MQGDETTNDTAAPVESSAPAVEPVSSTPSTDAPSATSEKAGEQSKETLLDAVLKVTEVTPEETVEKDAKDDAPQHEEPTSEVKAEGERQEGDEDEPVSDDEPSKELPAQTRKKINRLLRDRRELRDEVAQLRPAAEIGQQLHDFQQMNNLSTESIVDALEMLVAVNVGDYAGFYQKIAPIIRHTQEVLGYVLPPDIQQMVEHEQMTPSAAQQLAQTRFERANYEVQARQMQARQEHAAVHQMKDAVQRSVSALEQRFAASDPDYKAIQESVRREAQALLFERGGQVKSVDEAVQLTQQAYDNVSSRVRKLRQPSRPTALAPGRSNPQTPAARPQPKSMMDAVMNALTR